MAIPNIAVYQYSNIGPACVGAKSDTVNFVADATNNQKAYPYGWVVCETAGNIVVLDLDGNVHTFTGIAAGYIIPFPVKRVNSTNTTVTAFAYMIPVKF